MRPGTTYRICCPSIPRCTGPIPLADWPGATHADVYAGTAGCYLLRGRDDDAVAGQLPGPAPKRGDAPGTKYYELPLVIQDRSFNTDGSLFHPASREFFNDFAGPYIGKGDSDIAPIWNPEVFANTMVV